MTCNHIHKDAPENSICEDCIKQIRPDLTADQENSILLRENE